MTRADLDVGAYPCRRTGGHPGSRPGQAFAGIRAGASESGFTLLETLLATALFLIVMAALATVTGQWLPSWNHGFARVQRTEHLALGLERIMADVAAAQFISPNATVKRPVFDGTELSVIMVRSAVGPNAQPGLEYLRFSEIASERGPVLVRASAPFVPVEPDASVILGMKFSEPVVLVRPPFRVSFAYSGPDRVWQPTWQGSDQLPSAIRVTVRNAVSGEVLTVSSAVKVHVTAPALCANAQAQSCKDLTATLKTPDAANNPVPPNGGAPNRQ
jgi:general secretion pathway protein J